MFLLGVISTEIAQKIFTHPIKFSELLGFNFFLNYIVESLIFICLHVYYEAKNMLKFITFAVTEHVCNHLKVSGFR